MPNAEQRSRSSSSTTIVLHLPYLLHHQVLCSAGHTRFRGENEHLAYDLRNLQMASASLDDLGEHGTRKTVLA